MTLEAYSSIRANRHLNILLQGLPGSGKTRFISGFPQPCLIDFDDGDLTLQALGIRVPVLRPKNEDEIRAIIEDFPRIVENVIQPMKDDTTGKRHFEDYIPETIGWDTISTMQDTIIGEGPFKEVDLGYGTIDERDATGILALPAKRENAQIPAIKDYSVFNSRMRKLLLSIKQMPYHTILAAHTAPSDQVQSVSIKGNTPPPKDGWPLLIGQLRYQVGGLADFFLHLSKSAGIYTIETQKTGVFHCKNRAEHLFPEKIRWKDKNAFDIINEPLQKKLESLQ